MVGKRVIKLLKKSLTLLKKRWYLFAIILVVVGFLLYRQLFVSSGEKETPYKVERQTLEEELTFSGEVDAEERANLQFQTGGRLAWVGVKEGDRVNVYQAIASLDQRQLKKTLEKYLNTYAKTRIDFDQQKDDTREVVIGGLGYDQRQRVLRVADKYQLDLNNSVLDVELQSISMEYSNLSTPIAGVVDHVEYPVAGVNISALSTTPAFRVVNPQTIYFAAEVDQTDVVRIKEGQLGTINFDSYPDEDIPAVVKSISFSPIEGETGTVYEVKIEFLDDFLTDDYKYRLGMTGDISFVAREISNALSVPTTYLKTEEGKQYVLKDVKGKAIKTYVETGETIDTQTIITSGLEEGDIIYD